MYRSSAPWFNYLLARSRKSVLTNRTIFDLANSIRFDLSPSVAQAPDLQGYIFDVDGVLTDTAEFHYRAWQRLADEEKLPFDRQANEALRGVARRESLMHIVGDKEYSEAALQAMMERKNRYYVESLA